MKSKLVTILLVTLLISVVVGAEQNPSENVQATDQSENVIQLPPSNTPEYWNVRSEAISELLPLLTKKRSQTKSLKQLLTDYLLNIDKASDFADKNIPIPEDVNVYFEILQIGQGLQEMNIPKPTKSPSWDDIMEVSMKHVVFEGYLPTHVEEGEDLAHFMEMCKKKEEYGQKVRKELRAAADQCARMWVYLDSIGRKDDFKVSYVALREEQEAQKAQAKAEYQQASQQQRLAQTQEKQQRQFEDAESRASFSSSRKELRYDDRQSRREHSQTLLDSRFINSGVYYH